MYDDRGLVGVGGWLAFFVLSFAILSPLRMALGLLPMFGDPAIATGYGDAWAPLVTAEIILAVLVVLIAWYCAYRLFRVEVWRTVRIVIAALWVTGPVAYLIDLLLVTMIGGAPFGLLIETTIFDGLRSIAYAGIWTAYFLMSQRVANTYEGRHPDDVAARFA